MAFASLRGLIVVIVADKELIIRPARLADAFPLSMLIRAALHQTNATDYSSTVIDGMTRAYGPARIALMIDQREMFVADQDGEILGMIGYAGGAIRSLFVTPDHQRQGIGRELIAEAEHLAKKAGIRSLTVAASLTGTDFYRRCGFHELRSVDPSGIHMMLMHKWLSEPTDIVDSWLSLDMKRKNRFLE